MTTETQSVVSDSERVIVGWIELRKGFHSYLTSEGCLLVFREGVLRHMEERPRESARTETGRKKKKGGNRGAKTGQTTLVSDTDGLAEDDDEQVLLPDLEALFTSSSVDVASAPAPGTRETDPSAPNLTPDQLTKSVGSINSIISQPADDSNNSNKLPAAGPRTKYFSLPLLVNDELTSHVHTVQLSGWKVTISSASLTAATSETPLGSSSSSQDNAGHSSAGDSVDNKPITLSSSSPTPLLLSSPESIMTGRFTYTITLEDITAYSSMKLMVYYEVKAYLKDCQALRISSTQRRTDTHLSAYTNSIDGSGNVAEENEDEEVLSVPSFSTIDTRLRQSLPLLVPVVRYRCSPSGTHDKAATPSPAVILLTYEYFPGVST